jgi:hypothetical protein
MSAGQLCRCQGQSLTHSVGLPFRQAFLGQCLDSRPDPATSSPRASSIAQQSEEQVLSAYVLVCEANSFFGGIRQHAFGFVGKRKIDRSRGLWSR